MRRHLQALAVPLVFGGAAIAIAACSSGSGSSSTATSSAAAATASASASAGARGGAGLLNDPAVAACLSAAGITVPTPTGTFTRPTDQPTGARPSGSFTRPSGAGTGGANGGPGGAGGFGGDSTQAAAIQAALKACGITLPTGGAGASGAAPTAAPTS